MQKKVFVVIVTYNGLKWIDKCLTSLRTSSYPVQVIVVDNGSTDGCSERISRNYSEVNLVNPKNNLGFGKANNLGMRIALDLQADYVFLLNQDAWIENNTILELVKASQLNPAFGLISPIHINGTYSALDYNFSLQIAPLKCPRFYSDLYFNELDDIYEVEFVNAAAWLITSKCIKKVGLFEPLFFLYGEDNNYLQRVRYHGFKAGIVSRCTICHDREIRMGKPNSTGISLQERTASLILLLNINMKYQKCIILFLKSNISSVIKKVVTFNIRSIMINIKEMVFFVKNYSRLKMARNRYL